MAIERFDDRAGQRRTAQAEPATEIGKSNGTASAPVLLKESAMIDYTEKIRTTWIWGGTADRSALEHWQPKYMGWVVRHGPNESHNFVCTCERRSAWSRMDGRSSTT
jgi:hypothetical protein